jgi:acid phosphatase (class A)
LIRKSSAPLALVGLVVLLGCSAARTTPDAPPASPASVPEVRPGILAGYLADGSALPDSEALLPPPPRAGSDALAADEEAYRAHAALRGSPRWELAARDADLSFPAAAGAFSCAIGTAITEEATPRLYTLLRRSMVDAGRATRAAKDAHRRPRPFVVHRDSSCVPAAERGLAADGSYPSGHAAIGWAWSLILAELAPDRIDLIVARGASFGQSRVVCGVHWQSDVIAGRAVGAAVVARLHADEAFRADLEAARAELAGARSGGPAPDRDCAAEATALAETAR